MAAIERGATSSAANPILHTFTPRAGILQDAFALEFQIFDLSTGTPVQTFPGAGRHTVDLDADRIGLGHYAAAWTVAAMEPFGRHEIRWFATLADGDAEIAWRRQFDVLAYVIDNGRGYTLVSDVRAEGAASTTTDERIQNQIALASDLIEKWTARSFEPVYKPLSVDGSNTRLLRLDEPIIALEQVTNERTGTVIEAERYRVYNRHITQRLLDPDDRNAPRIELIDQHFAADFATAHVVYGPALWPHLRDDWGGKRGQTTVVKGVFGYTDWDGSPTGRTPTGIRRACTLLTLHNLTPAGPSILSTGGGVSGPVKRKKTREQEIEYADADKGPNAERAAPFTGNPEIDFLILGYCRSVTGTAV